MVPWYSFFIFLPAVIMLGFKAYNWGFDACSEIHTKDAR